jgi:hypothetical protein
MSNRKIQIIKELLDKKEITFEQALLLLDIKIEELSSPINLGITNCQGNCDNCTCKK